MTYPWVTFIELHTWEMPQYGHNRTTGHWAAPLERLGIKRFSQGQPLSTERMKGFCFTIDFSSFLLFFPFGAFMDEQQRLCIRNAMFIFETQQASPQLFTQNYPVCVRLDTQQSVRLQYGAYLRIMFGLGTAPVTVGNVLNSLSFRLPGPTYRCLNSEEHEGIKPYSSTVVWFGTKAKR